ncbi:MAG: glycosyltransferase family 4 protein [Candidatus Aenigmarchaeota archaeon]|nr:glycosyltransferase family 4 protein [Candidatus Aenigmarchaeota archaeon]MDW8159914.1 glycosyltransferase family 4 protein [Candidatus Aenigmarchaeota archaeon]
MRILQVGVTLPEVGGAERHIYELCKRLSEKMEVILLTQKASRPKGFLPKVKIVEVPVIRKNVYLRNLSFSIFSIIPLIKVILKEKPDLIHIHYGVFQSILGLLSRIFGKKIVYTVHGFSGWRMSKKIIRNLVTLILNHSYKVVCVSPAVVEDLGKFGVKKRKMVYIPNGINFKDFKIKHRKVKKNITFFGRLHKQKGVEYLILAFKKIYKSHRDFKLIIIGDGPDRKRLEEMCGDIANRVIFTGYVDRKKLIRYLMESCMIVLPSLYEGFPLALLEAMCSGRPVITTNIKPIRSVVKDGVIFVGVKDVEGLSRRIIKLIKNQRLREFIGRKGREVAKKFDWSFVVDEHIKLYNLLISKCYDY